MRLITARVLDRKRLHGPELACFGLWLGGLAGLEVFGRSSQSELGDAVGVAGVLALALSTGLWHSVHPMPVLTAARSAADKLRERILEHRYRFGLDLRELPPLRRAYPPKLVALAIALVAVCALFAWQREHFPGDLRALGLRTSGALYLIALTVLWSVLVVGGFVLAFGPIGILLGHVSNSPRLEPFKRELLLGAGALEALIALCGFLFLPPHAPLYLVGFVFAVFSIASLAPGAPRLELAWREHIGRAEARSAPWGGIAVLLHTLTAALFFLLHVLCTGDRGMASAGATTPITVGLGVLFSWAFAAAYAAELLPMGYALALGWVSRLAARHSPRVHVSGFPSGSERERLRARLGAAGFRASFGPRRPGDVPIVLRRGRSADAEGSSLAAAWPPAWPLAVGEADLANADVLFRIGRRAEIQERRALLHGLERIFKAARRRSFERGSGFWVAPHCWFITHLSRDVDEADGWFIGPPYHRAIRSSARRYFAGVLRRLQVDLIYVEDGVGYRRLRRVLAMLFEFHDMFGGRRVLEEVHFAGLPGVRVLLDDFRMDAAPNLSQYPEPDYEDLGRARILFVFRDRGEAHDRIETPPEVDRTPTPRRTPGAGPPATPQPILPGLS